MKVVCSLFLLIFILNPIQANKPNNQMSSADISDSITQILKRGLAYEDSNSDSAILCYNIALNIADENLKTKKDEQVLKLKAKAFENLGYLYKKNLNYDSSINHLTKSIEIYQKLDAPNKIAICYHTMGNIYSANGNFIEAEQSFNQAFDNFTKTNHQYGKIACLTSFGIINNEQGNFDKAIKNHLDAIKIAEEIQDSNSIAISSSNIGIIHFYQDNDSAAIAYYTKALNIYKQLKNIAGKIPIYTNIGLCYNNLQQYNKALTYIDSSLSISEKIDDYNSMAYGYNAKGEIYARINNISEAYLNYLKSYELRKKLNYKNGIAISGLNLAHCLIEMKEFEKAERYLSKSQQISFELNSLSMQADVYKYYKQLYKAQNEYQLAFEYFEKEQKLTDSVFNSEKHKQISELETQYQTEKKEQEIKSLQQENELQNQKVLAQRRLTLFVGSSALLLLILGIVYYLWKKAKHVNIENELQIKNLLTEQKMLRSQMNPHFIYNSLNSIQSFISSDDSYQAEKYLAQFAKLMRGILENSRENLIPLDKEIEVLDLYLQLEQLRFEKRFEYKITIDETIETDFIAIPPMLIQPFIENAILHGLKQKDNGLIYISFIEKDEQLICEVDDNGIGRQASAQMQQKKQHKSLATTITQERLDALEQELGKPAKFEFIDKTDSETHESLGTKVVVTIPIIEA